MTESQDSASRTPTVPAAACDVPRAAPSDLVASGSFGNGQPLSSQNHWGEYHRYGDCRISKYLQISTKSDIRNQNIYNRYGS